MNLGAFSISLAVSDIKLSREFYSKLGFTVSGGDEEQHWLIMKNGLATIGLFQDMFEQNILTFNPGWDQDSTPLSEFTDVRGIQSALLSKGVALTQDTNSDGKGPAHITLLDPDGNPVLIDQHCQKPE